MRGYMMAAAALALAGGASAANAVVIDLDSVANASLLGENGITQNFAAGSYTISFIDGAQDAWTRFASVDGCDGNGENCTQGFELSAAYSIAGIVTRFGDSAGLGGIGPTPTPDNAYFSTAAAAFAAGSPVYNLSFTLPTAQDVTFFLTDDQLGDNSGGVTLNIVPSAVPEPAAWAMMIGGFGLVGGAMRRRRSALAAA